MKCTGCSAPVGLLFSGVTSEVDPALYDILPTQERHCCKPLHCNARDSKSEGGKGRKTDAAAFRLMLTEPTLTPINVKMIPSAEQMLSQSVQFSINLIHDQ